MPNRHTGFYSLYEMDKHASKKGNLCLFAITRNNVIVFLIFTLVIKARIVMFYFDRRGGGEWLNYLALSG